MRKPTRFPLLLILGIILLFLAACAIFNNLSTPKYGQLTMHYPDGDTIAYVLPPEFPELKQEELEIYPVTFYIIVARRTIGENIYGLFLWAPEAIGLGCGMLIDGKEQYWIYDSGGIPQPCTDKELNALLTKWDNAEGVSVEPKKQLIST